MSDKLHKTDLRIKKTHKALLEAFHALLSRQKFNHLTVNALCEAALISRATFYTHFNDKYALLQFWLSALQKELIKNVYDFSSVEANVNGFFKNNRILIRNVVKDADSMTLELIYEFMASIVRLALKRKFTSPAGRNQTILFNFCVGGLTQHLLWLVKNNFPDDVTMINRYFYDMLEKLTLWDAAQEMGGSTFNR